MCYRVNRGGLQLILKQEKNITKQKIDFIYSPMLFKIKYTYSFVSIFLLMRYFLHSHFCHITQ